MEVRYGHGVSCSVSRNLISLRKVLSLNLSHISQIIFWFWKCTCSCPSIARVVDSYHYVCLYHGQYRSHLGSHTSRDSFLPSELSPFPAPRMDDCITHQELFKKEKLPSVYLKLLYKFQFHLIIQILALGKLSPSIMQMVKL